MSCLTTLALASQAAYRDWVASGSLSSADILSQTPPITLSSENVFTAGLPPSIAWDVAAASPSDSQAEVLFTGAITKYVTAYEPANLAEFQLVAGPSLPR